MELVVNQKTEVTKEQFGNLKKDASGIVAFRQEGEKYFIKLMMSKYKNYVEKIMESSLLLA